MLNSDDTGGQAQPGPSSGFYLDPSIRHNPVFECHISGNDLADYGVFDGNYVTIDTRVLPDADDLVLVRTPLFEVIGRCLARTADCMLLQTSFDVFNLECGQIVGTGTHVRRPLGQVLHKERNMSDETPEAIPVPAFMLPDANVGAFHVKGDGMSGDKIHDGDYVLVDLDAAVADGDTAVVQSDRGGAVGRLQRMPDGLRLDQSNPAVEAPVFGADTHPVITGKVIAVMRNII